MLDTTIVIPCYNEARRLDIDCFVRFVTGDPPCRLLLVDDGSSDDTLSVLEELRECAPQHVDVLALERNQGKAEAVRRGVLAAMARGAKYVGYWDADLATPLEAIAEFRAKLASDQQLQAIFGSRVRMLGRNIRRQLVRHLLGRAFATGASVTLGLGVYDTQCGAKLFRADRKTQLLFEQPFLTSWIFDVELIARMLGSGASRQAVAAAIYEMPLDNWYDVAGSKVRPRDFFKALFQLSQIYWKYLRGIPDVAVGAAVAAEAAETEQAGSDRLVKVSRQVDSKPRKTLLTQP
jgi:glycosyltransferase involved in cell wall biosynthesis